jgi:hypothetical protein
MIKVNHCNTVKTIKLGKYLAFGIFTWYVLLGFNGFAQTKAELKASKKLFGGSWINNKAQRHLIISFDTEDYA